MMKTGLKKRALLIATMAGAAAWPAETVLAAEDLRNQVNVRVDRAWQFIVAPYFVGANITGTSQVGRLPNTDVDVSTGDILENLHFGGMIHAEALYDQTFGAFIDIAYMKLGNAQDILRTGGRARVGVSQLIVETMLTYRAYSSGNGFIDIYAGGRYWDISMDLNVTGSIAGNFTTTRGDNWWDPVIGLRGSHDLTDKWSLNARADIGGFGLASDFTWNVQGGAGYRFSEVWAAHLQYKVLSVDYDNGRSGTSSFAYDAITHGPVLGVSATF
ncbi:hypothetical protein [Roseibium sp.]|uniref:hypothetical protein n=1 Tax=Roseibium sp. TaxID=1936156 RepID=UPI003263E101